MSAGAWSCRFWYRTPRCFIIDIHLIHRHISHVHAQLPKNKRKIENTSASAAMLPTCSATAVANQGLTMTRPCRAMTSTRNVYGLLANRKSSLASRRIPNCSRTWRQRCQSLLPITEPRKCQCSASALTPSFRSCRCILLRYCE